MYIIIIMFYVKEGNRILNIEFVVNYFYGISILNCVLLYLVEFWEKNFMNFKWVLLILMVVEGGMSSFIIRGWYWCNVIVGNCGCVLCNIWNMLYYKDNDYIII